jgi:hypothetical protein
LPSDHQVLLTKLYVSFGMSTDQLLNDTAKADRLTRRFNATARGHLSSELLLRELLRLRKGGKLPSMAERHRPKRVPRPARAPSSVRTASTRA